MKKTFLGVVAATFLFTGCDLLKDEGTLNIETMKNISIYVDGEFKTDAGENTKLVLKEGTHKIKVYGVSKDGDWEYKAEEDVVVGGKVEKTIAIIPIRYPTQQKREKDEQQRAEEEKKEKELLAFANEKGCTSYNDYTDTLFLKENLKTLKDKISNIENDRTTYIKDSGFYLLPNDFIDFESFSFDRQSKSFLIKIKNKANGELTYFWTKFYFLNENFELIGEVKKYKENISVKPGESKLFKYEIVSYLDGDLLRKLLMTNKLNMVAKIEKLTIKDQYGELKKDFENVDFSKLKTISINNVENIKQQIIETENTIKEKCSNL